MTAGERPLGRAAALVADIRAGAHERAAGAMRVVTWLALPVVLGVVLGMSIAAYWVQPIWDEQAWYLYVAGRALDGATLYGVEIVDVSPPLTIWLSEIPVMVARWLGVSPIVGMKLGVAVLIGAVLWWCFRLIRASRSALPDWLPWWFVAVGIYVLGVYPGSDLGQREHLLVIMTLPYLAIAALRIAGGAVSPGSALAAGVLAGIGIAIKPYYLILMLGVESVLLLRRRRLRGLFRPETFAILATGLVYCAEIWIVTPAYLTKYVPMLLEVYRDFGDNDWATVLPLSRIVKIGGLIAVCVVLGRRLKAEPLITLLVAAGLAGAVAYVLQGKAWSYQLLPEASFLRFAIGLILAELFLAWVALPSAAPMPKGVRAGALALSGALAVALSLPGQRAMAEHQWSDDMVAEYLDATSSYPAGTPILVLSPNTYYAHQVALDRGFTWPSRYEELWMLSSVLRNESGYAGLRQPLPPEKVAELARETRAAVSEDIAHWRPSVIFVERCSEEKPCYSLEGLRVDIAEWFSRDDDFKRVWSDYHLDRRLDVYDVYLRKDATTGS